MKVTHIQLTSALFVPGMDSGHGGITLQRTVHGGPQGYPGIEMDVTPLGVECRFKGARFLIPIGNIQVAMIDQAASTETTNVKASARKA